MSNENLQSNKVKRSITGWIVGLIALACVCMGAIPLFLFLTIMIFFASKEYVSILEHKGFYPSFTTILLIGLALSLLVFFHRFDLLPSIVTIGVIGAFLMILFRGRQPYIANVATTVLGFMYGGWLACHLLLIRQIGATQIGAFKIGINEGLFLLIFMFLAVVVTDIGAYYFGMKFGKHKLAPEISPKKTVEGAIGGGIAAILISLLGVFYTNLSLLQCLIGGFLITLSAQLGDLSESLIKRDAGVKDSSNILPGHGGFLDRADGYIFAMPVAYYYFVNFTQGNNIFLEFFKYVKGLLNAYF